MKIKIKKKGGINMETNVEDFYTKTVTKFGNGAKIDASKKLIGKKVMVLVLKENKK